MGLRVAGTGGRVSDLNDHQSAGFAPAEPSSGHFAPWSTYARRVATSAADRRSAPGFQLGPRAGRRRGRPEVTARTTSGVTPGAGGVEAGIVRVLQASRSATADRGTGRRENAMHYLLIYDVVPNYVERRAPLRA